MVGMVELGNGNYTSYGPTSPVEWEWNVSNNVTGNTLSVQAANASGGDIWLDYPCGVENTVVAKVKYTGAACSDWTNKLIKVKLWSDSTEGGTWTVKPHRCEIETAAWTDNDTGWTDNCYRVRATDAATATLYYKWSWYGSKGNIYAEPAESREEFLKRRIGEIIDKRCAPNIIIRQNDRRKPMPMPADIREIRARETLRRVIGDRKFASFIKTGFVSVRARSGLVYQIFPGHGITCVFNQGQLVERLCVVLQGNFPPTDSLIMRYLMILNNENQFRSFAVKHGVHEPATFQVGEPDTRSLAEIFKELKTKVA